VNNHSICSKERVQTTLALHEPDRVPIFELAINSPVASEIMGRGMLVGIGGRMMGPVRHDYSQQPGGLAALTLQGIKDHLDLYEELDLDLITLPTIYYEDAEIKEIAPLTYQFTQRSDGSWRIIKADLEADTWGEVDCSIKQQGMDGFRRHVEYLEGSQPLTIPPAVIQALKAMLAPHRRRFLLGVADVIQPNHTSWFQIFLEAMVLEPELVERYLIAGNRSMLNAMDAQIEAGFDGFIGGTDFAGINGPYFSPAMFRRFFVPRLKEITGHCHRHGRPFFKHTDGNITALGEAFLTECGFDGYHAIEPAAGMDIFALKKSHGRRLTLLGNVDCGRLLCQGEPEEVAVAVKQLIQGCAPGGGYILSSSNSIHSGVKTKNFLAMLEAARKFGQYPIRNNE